MIDEELVVQIRRHFFRDHWRVGTIAAALAVHAETVQRAIGTSAFHRASNATRQRLIDPYLGLIEATLREHPRLRATRIFEMARARGYQGSVVQLRRVVRTLRPAPVHEAFLRLRALPGEQAQVDWASFGTVAVGQAKRRLCCFVMVLSYSRALYVEFCFGDDLASFLAGHVHAFEAFGGVARTVLHDNLKSAVIARRHELIAFHPRYLELAGHYCFAAQACRPRRANEKGRVERAIGYVRTSFFAARNFHALADLNHQARRWVEEIAGRRPWPDDPSRTVAEAFAEEQPRLHPLPLHPLATATSRAVSAKKTIYVRFEGNHYSIPPAAVGRPLTLLADATTVRLLDGATEIARHTRSYDRNQDIEDRAHTEALLAIKRRAFGARTPTALAQQVPEVEAFLSAAFEQGEIPGQVTRHLSTLLTLYGLRALRAAIVAALDRGTPRLASLRFLLERDRRQHPAARPVDLGNRPHLQDLHVQPHDLETYDDPAEDDHSDDS